MGRSINIKLLKLLIVGSDKIFAIENFYVKYLRVLGVEVVQFAAHSRFIDYHQRSFLNKVLLKLGFSCIYARINRELRELIATEKPDIVWIFKGMEIFPHTFEWIRRGSIKLVNYNPDNPFLFSGRGSGNRNITDSLRYYDLHFTYNLAIKQQLEKDYKATVCLLPFGFDISEELYAVCQLETEVLEVCFLGNPDKERAAFILALANKGIEITVYGHDWDKFVNHASIKIYRPVYADEQWKVVSRYRVQLNLMRPHNLNSHNMRTFEVPGVGGIMLAPDTVEHRMFFENGRECFLFQDDQECVDRIRWLLALPKVEADAIRRAARKRSLDSGYTYQARAAQVLAELNNVRRG